MLSGKKQFVSNTRAVVSAAIAAAGGSPCRFRQRGSSDLLGHYQPGHGSNPTVTENVEQIYFQKSQGQIGQSGQRFEGLARNCRILASRYMHCVAPRGALPTTDG